MLKGFILGLKSGDLLFSYYEFYLYEIKLSSCFKPVIVNDLLSSS